MKRLLFAFILLLLPIMGVGQTKSTGTILYEKDFTGITEFTGWYQFDDSQIDGKVEVDPDGLAITVGVQTGELWQPQVMVIPNGSFNLEESGSYRVVITAKFPTDGILQIHMGSWGAYDEDKFPVTATGDFQEVVCDFDSWSLDAEGSHLLFQCGDFKGTTIVKKIQVINMSNAIIPFSIDNMFYIINTIDKTAKVTSNPQKYTGEVTIPSTVRYERDEYPVISIDKSAFQNCSGLTSITIPNSVTSIGRCAFWACYNLKSIMLGNSVTRIGDNAFWQCYGLTSVTIPNSVTRIGPNAFSECTGLKSVIIPNSVTTIGKCAFSGCNNLTSIRVESGNTKFDSRDNCNAIIETASNTLIVGCKSTVIPNNVTSIGDDAFYHCSGLTSITIPNSVTSIRDNAFLGLSGLTSIISLNNTPPTCEQNDYHGSFYSVDNTNCVVWVPKGSVNAYKEADGWKDFGDIRELSLGDVNVDFKVNHDDLNATTSHIMGEEPEGFYENLADLNDDNEVNAADVVKLVDILHVQDGLSTDWQPKFDSYQVITSLACTLNNNGNKPIQVTKCELYHDQSLVSYATSNVTLDSGESKKCSFNDLANLSTKKGFYVLWHCTCNGESYTCRFDLPE